MITLQCEICGGNFYVKPYRVKTARFCSKQCGGVWHAKTRLPEHVRKHAKGNKYRLGKTPANAFQKGMTPWNKGVKGIRLSPSTEFKKGMKSPKEVPILTIKHRKCKNKETRAFIKVSETAWKPLAVYVWEQENGPLPAGLLIHHRDRNALNDEISNLEPMTRAQHIEEHRYEFIARRKSRAALGVK